jgi:DNA-binding transcriptional ArsR family regulator
LKLYKNIQNTSLVQALAHPLRAKMLSVLQEQEASPKELAAHFGVPLSNVAYHIQVLRKLKLIRLVKKTPRRGAVEHHYKADHPPHIDDEAWSQTPGVIKQGLAAAALEDIGGYVQRAAAMGGFNRRNAHLTRTGVVLDEEAWDLLAARLMELLDFVDELESESSKRLRRKDHEGERRAALVMMLFEPLPGVPDPDEAQQAGPSACHLEERQIGTFSSK